MRVTLMAVLFLSGCAHVPEAKQCSDSKALMCVTRTECSYDRARDCQMCQCESINGANSGPRFTLP